MRLPWWLDKALDEDDMALQKIIGSDVKKAEAKLTEAKSFVSTLKEKATEEVSKSGQTHLNSKKFEKVGMVPAGVELFSFDTSFFGLFLFE